LAVLAPESEGNPTIGKFDLSVMQARVLSLAADGLTDREIARALGISLDRVKREVRSALLLLSSRNRTQAVVTALRAGMLSA
jgi:two-component system nitrate/nitrite response regulator NarL